MAVFDEVLKALHKTLISVLNISIVHNQNRLVQVVKDEVELLLVLQNLLDEEVDFLPLHFKDFDDQVDGDHHHSD